MIKLEGHGRPTKFKAAEKGTIYTDLNTGKRYKCLGTIGFVNSDAVNEPVEYQWKLVDMVEESQMPEGSGGGNVELPFGEKEVDSNILVWDCDTTGKESPDGMMYFVCDAEVTYEQLKKRAVVECYSNGEQTTSLDFVNQINDMDAIITEAFCYAKFDGAKAGNTTYPKRGFYCYPLPNCDEFRIVLDESVKPFKTIETVPLPTKYLPEHLQFGESVYGEKIAEFTTDVEEFCDWNGEKIIYRARTSTSGGGEYNIPAPPSYGSLQSNDCIAIFDGVEYKLSIWSANYGGATYGIGNRGLYFTSHEEDTGVPFSWQYWAGGYELITKEPGEHTLVVYLDEHQYSKIKPEYIPTDGIEVGWDNIKGRPFGYTTNAKYNLLEGNDLLCRFDKLVLPEGATSDRTTSPNYGTITMPFSADAYTTHITYIDGGGTIHTDPLEFEWDDTGRIGTASWYSYPATIKLEYDENWSNCTLTLVIPTYMSGECSAMPLYISDMNFEPIPYEYISPRPLYINNADNYIYTNPYDNKIVSMVDIMLTGNFIIYLDWYDNNRFTTMFSVMTHDDGYAIVRAVEIQDDGDFIIHTGYTKEWGGNAPA